MSYGEHGGPDADHSGPPYRSPDWRDDRPVDNPYGLHAPSGYVADPYQPGWSQASGPAGASYGSDGPHQQGQPYQTYPPYPMPDPPAPAPGRAVGSFSYGSAWTSDHLGDPGTLDLPYYGIGFGGAVKRAFQKYARFDGRASRGEYWWFVLFSNLVYAGFFVLALIAALLSSGIDDGSVAAAPIIVCGVLFLCYLLGTIVPTIAIGVRRLHDENQSGAMYLLCLIPYVGSLILLIIMAQPSSPFGVRYDRIGTTAGTYPGGS